MAQVARGPLQALLQTASGQWIILGAGVYTLFPEKVQAAMMRLLAQAPPGVASQFHQAIAGGKQDDATVSTTSASAVPPSIVIHTGRDDSSGSSKLSWKGTVVAYVAGAGVIWLGYILASHALPDMAKELLPVTRKFFERTSQTLGQGILNVREVLEEKISALFAHQEDLERKLDENTTVVVDIQDELGNARGDLTLLGASLERCETSLENSQLMQGYTTRGVKLLVRCVANMLPGNDGFLQELAQFIQEGEGVDTPQKSTTSKFGTPPSSRRLSMQTPPETQHPGYYRRSKSLSSASPQQPPSSDDSLDDIRLLVAGSARS